MVDEGEKGLHDGLLWVLHHHKLTPYSTTQSSFSLSKFLAHGSLDIYGSIQIDVWTKSVYTAN